MALCGQTLLAANMQATNDAPYQLNSHNARSKLVEQLNGIYNRARKHGGGTAIHNNDDYRLVNDTWKCQRFCGVPRRRTKSDLEQYLDKVELDAATELFCDDDDDNIGARPVDDGSTAAALTNGDAFVVLNDTAPFLPRLIDEIAVCFDTNDSTDRMSNNKRIHSRIYNVSVLERCAQFENKTSTACEGYHSEVDSSSAVSSLHSSQCGTITSEDYYYLDDINTISSDSSSRLAIKDEFCGVRQQKRRKRRLRSQSLGPRKSYDNVSQNIEHCIGFHYSASSSSTETLLNDQNKTTAVAVSNEPVTTSLLPGAVVVITPAAPPGLQATKTFPQQQSRRAGCGVVRIPLDRVLPPPSTRAVDGRRCRSVDVCGGAVSCTTQSASVNADLNCTALLLTEPCLKDKVTAASRRSNSVSSWLERQTKIDERSNADASDDDDVCSDRLSHSQNNNNNNNTTGVVQSGGCVSGRASSTKKTLAGFDVINLTKMDSFDDLIRVHCSSVSDSEESVVSHSGGAKHIRQQQQQQQQQDQASGQSRNQRQQQQQPQQQQRRRTVTGRSQSFAAGTKLSASDQRQRGTTRATMALRDSMPLHNVKLATRVPSEQRRTTIQTAGKGNGGVQYHRHDEQEETAQPSFTAVTISTGSSTSAGSGSDNRGEKGGDAARTPRVQVAANKEERRDRDNYFVSLKSSEQGTNLDSSGIQSGATSTGKATVIVARGLEDRRCSDEEEDDDDDCSLSSSGVDVGSHGSSNKVGILVDGLPNRQQQHVHCGDVVRLQVSLNPSSSALLGSGSHVSSPASSTCDSGVVESFHDSSSDSRNGGVNVVQIDATLQASGSEALSSFELAKCLDYNPNITELSSQPKDPLVSGNPSCLSCSALASCLVQLKMDNARLQQLLYDVEQARSGTVKALLQANTLLKNVQNENTMLQGQVRVIEQEKTYLEDNLRSVKQGKPGHECYSDAPDGSVLPSAIHGLNCRPEFDGSLKAIAETWKKEKREMMKSLSATTTRAETAEKDAERLRVQFKKIKEQLQNANDSYSTLLKSNGDLTAKFDDQFKALNAEKDDLLSRIATGDIVGKDFEVQRHRIADLTSTLEETQDERDNLQRQVTALEKQKRDVLSECDELHEQLDHCEDLLEKMTETEEEIRARLDKEISEKTYLQGCLDETGTILLHLRGNERQLKEEKDVLEEDLETEIQQKQTLKQKLQKTAQEHKDICSELEEMSNIHVTVRESLQLAGKKEKSYQQQIDELTRTNHILHYSLEKEKEEGGDLRVLFDCLEMELKHLKRDSSGEIKTLSTRVDELTVFSETTSEKLKASEKQCDELRNHLEQEEEDNDGLRKANARLEKLRSEQESELGTMREKRDLLENEVLSIKRQAHEFKKSFDTQFELSEELQERLTKSEDTLTKTAREWTEMRETLHKREFEAEEIKARMKSKQKKIHEMDNDLTDATQAKVRSETRLRGFEKEVKELRVTVQEQNEELGTLRFEVKRIARERDVAKREADGGKTEFDYHKSRCSETMKNLRDEVISLQNKLMDKDRFTMKQKESLQDTIDTTSTDLALLRHFMSDEVSRSNGGPQHDAASLSDKEQFDLQHFKGVNQKNRQEMQAQVSNLEGMLEMSKQRSDNNVVVVQSPMSKLKLEEIKKLRDDIHHLARETVSVRSRLRSAYEELMILKLSLEPVGDVVPSASDKAKMITRSVELERHLVALDNAIYDVENQHNSVIKNNLGLLNRSGAEPQGEAAPANTSMATVREENLKLKTLLRMLKRKYKFEENEIWVESVRSLQGMRQRRDDVMAMRRASAPGEQTTGIQRGYDSECSTGSDTVSESSSGPRLSWRERRALRGRTSNGRETDEEESMDKFGRGTSSGGASPMRLSRTDEIASTGNPVRRSSSLLVVKPSRGQVPHDVVSDLPPRPSTHSLDDRPQDDADAGYDPSPAEFKRSMTLPTRLKSRVVR